MAVKVVRNDFEEKCNLSGGELSHPLSRMDRFRVLSSQKLDFWRKLSVTT